MASLCSGSEVRRGEHRATPIYLEAVRTAFRLSARQRHFAGGLQGLLSAARQGRSFGQHGSNGTGIVAGLPIAPIRQREYNGVVATSLPASHSLADQGSGTNDTGSVRNPASIAVHHTGVKHWRSGRSDLRPDMGSRGLWQRNYKFHPAWAYQDEQAPSGSAYKHKRSNRTGGGLQRTLDRSCDRISRQAGEVGKKVAGETIKAIGRSLFSPCVPPHLRGLDGARRCADAKDSAVPRPHHNSSNRAGLRPIFAVIYEGCQRRRFMVVCTLVHRPIFKNGGKMVLLERIELSTSSLPMEASNANLPFFGCNYGIFRQYSAIKLYFRRFSCTYGTYNKKPPPLGRVTRAEPQRERTAQWTRN